MRALPERYCIHCGCTVYTLRITACGHGLRPAPSAEDEAIAQRVVGSTKNELVPVTYASPETSGITAG